MVTRSKAGRRISRWLRCRLGKFPRLAGANDDAGLEGLRKKSFEEEPEGILEANLHPVLSEIAPETVCGQIIDIPFLDNIEETRRLDLFPQVLKGVQVHVHWVVLKIACQQPDPIADEAEVGSGQDQPASGAEHPVALLKEGDVIDDMFDDFRGGDDIHTVGCDGKAPGGVESYAWDVWKLFPGMDDHSGKIRGEDHGAFPQEHVRHGPVVAAQVQNPVAGLDELDDAGDAVGFHGLGGRVGCLDGKVPGLNGGWRFGFDVHEESGRRLGCADKHFVGQFIFRTLILRRLLMR